MKFGEIIRDARLKKQLTYRAMADKLDNIISSAYINAIELHDEIPSPDTVMHLAEVLELNADELLEIAKQVKINEFNSLMNKKYRGRKK